MEALVEAVPLESGPWIGLAVAVALAARVLECWLRPVTLLPRMNLRTLKRINAEIGRVEGSRPLKDRDFRTYGYIDSFGKRRSRTTRDIAGELQRHLGMSDSEFYGLATACC